MLCLTPTNSTTMSLSLNLPCDFSHQPKEGFSYKVRQHQRNLLSIWLCHPDQYTYTANPVSTIWGFYNTKTKQYHAPINHKKHGKVISYNQTTAYTAMPLQQPAQSPPQDSASPSTMNEVQTDDMETFQDYVQQQDARNTIQLNIRKYALMLCDAIKHDFILHSIRSHEMCIYQADAGDSFSVNYHKTCIEKLKNGECDYDYILESGRKYYKIVQVNNQHSVHAFIDMKTGEVYKPASFTAPAKGVRYDLRLIKDREWLLENADWAGDYLYK